jgi:predicted CxxxxCH...CXXCH cytochrome family protein
MRHVILGPLAAIAASGLLGFGCNSGPPAANSFTEVYSRAIVPYCTSVYCHPNGVRTAGSGASALDMSSQTIAYWSLYDHLAEGPGCGAIEGRKRVVPYDPDNSVLYQKVHEANPCGAQMPADPVQLWPSGIAASSSSVFSGTALSPENQKLIYEWIKEGAQNN